MARTISSFIKVNPDHKNLILAEATRLNGNLNSMRNFNRLRHFAEKKCKIRIDNLTLRHLLQNRGRLVKPERGIRHLRAAIGVT